MALSTQADFRFPLHRVSATLQIAMSELFGETRTRVTDSHALIAEDSHVPSALPGFKNATPYYLISPAMGADLTQLLIRFTARGRARFPADWQESALYVQAGSCQVRIGKETRRLEAGGFAFCPAEIPLEITGARSGTAVTVFRKEFEALEETDPPPPVFGDAGKVKALPFMNNPRALLQTLLPEDFRYDLALNIFTYEPGATLPFVETHIMEHGLLMLEGQGLYRLADAYYPVKAGDVIWMAPYCPQWFVAMGDTPASYLYYKNVNRPA